MNYDRFAAEPFIYAVIKKIVTALDFVTNWRFKVINIIHFTFNGLHMQNLPRFGH